MSKRIVINAIALLSTRTGIGRYTYEIAKGMEKEEVTYYYGYFSKKLLEKGIRGKKILDKIPMTKKIARKALSMVPKTQFFDLYFEPNFIPQKIKAKRVVTTIHDLSFMLYPQWHPKERVAYFSKHFLPSLSKSDHFITVSHYIKKEMVEYLGIDEENISVIYNGVDHSTFYPRSTKEIQEFITKYTLPKRFILFVGSIEPRKNLLNLLRAYELLEERYKKEYHLVLAGFSGWKNREIMEIIEKNRESIHYIGYLDDEDLAKAYSAAEIFVYPSYYEGFGIPPLEAMACGTSVLTSKRASLPEVCADAALYCEPEEIEDIKLQLVTLMDDESRREELKEKGRKHVKEFTWEKAVEEHRRCFNNVLL